MNAPVSPLTDQADELLSTLYARLREPNVKMATFRTRNGRQMVLIRQARNDIFIWVECHEPSLGGVHINNQKHPGQPYSPEQPRAAIGTHCKNLGVGNEAYYLKCDTLGALERFARWYDTA